jgi:hypothetical protein
MKRKAIKTELIGVSNSNVKHYDYKITIEEKDGSITELIEHGKDLQDTLSRVIKTGRIKKIQQSLDKIIVLLIIVVIVFTAILIKVL